MTKDKSFIAKARQEQIIQAVIEVLNEIGYVQTSLAKIAKQAKISTGLVSYHFSDKEDLINHTLMYLMTVQVNYIKEHIEAETGAYQKLTAFIKASLHYQKQYYANNVAMLEIIFNARDGDNTPYYKLVNEGDDPIYVMLEQILAQGQQERVFAAELQPKTVSILINGAIGESMLLQNETFDMEGYQAELMKMVTKVVK